MDQPESEDVLHDQLINSKESHQMAAPCESEVVAAAATDHETSAQKPPGSESQLSQESSEVEMVSERNPETSVPSECVTNSFSAKAESAQCIDSDKVACGHSESDALSKSSKMSENVCEEDKSSNSLLSVENNADSSSNVTKEVKKNITDTQQKSLKTPIKSPQSSMKTPRRSSRKETLHRLTNEKTPTKAPNSAVKNAKKNLYSPTPEKSTTVSAEVTPSKDNDSREQFLRLTEELKSLNKDSVQLTTNLHQPSPQEGATPGKRKVFGERWSPKKLFLSKSVTPKKRKLTPRKRASVKRSILPPKKKKRLRNESGSEGTSGSDEVEEDPIDIDPEIDKEMDTALEEKSCQLNLTAANVKSILHNVITNEHVVEMLQNTLREDNPDDDTAIAPAVYEPKMTRAKVKEVFEKGNIPLPWTISPMKHKTDTSAASFLEMSFESDQEDDEYKPELDEASDTESYVSSRASDLGSPCSTTPRTPGTPILQILQSSDGELTPTSTRKSLQRADGPFLKPRPKFSHLPLPRNLREALDIAEEKEKETIALRTRSKLPLTDTPLEVIESSFVAPDITEDMYNTACDDQDWNTFLNGLGKSDAHDLNDTLDDEVNDPEYNFLADIDEEEMDLEEFRNDRAVSITKKELHELMDELFDAYGNENLSNEVKQPTPVKRNFNQPGTFKLSSSLANVVVKDLLPHKEKFLHPTPSVLIPSSVPQVTPEERLQIADHMRKHVQLLTQTFILSHDMLDYHKEAVQSRMYLKELHHFAQKSRAGSQSLFKAVNLSESLEIIDSLDIVHKAPVSKSKSKERFKKVNIQRLPLTYDNMELFVTRKCFVYPSLLPTQALIPKWAVGTRVSFTEAEDNLLALGIQQFNHLSKSCSLIKQFLLPTKTEKQIAIRIKNMSVERRGDNVVKQARKDKEASLFPRVIILIDENGIKPVQEQDSSTWPNWFFEYVSQRESRKAEECSERDLDTASEASAPSVTSTKNPGTPQSVKENKSKPVRRLLRGRPRTSGADDKRKKKKPKDAGIDTKMAGVSATVQTSLASSFVIPDISKTLTSGGNAGFTTIILPGPTANQTLPTGTVLPSVPSSSTSSSITLLNPITRTSLQSPNSGQTKQVIIFTAPPYAPQQVVSVSSSQPEGTPKLPTHSTSLLSATPVQSDSYINTVVSTPFMSSTSASLVNRGISTHANTLTTTVTTTSHVVPISTTSLSASLMCPQGSTVVLPERPVSVTCPQESAGVSSERSVLRTDMSVSGPKIGDQQCLIGVYDEPVIMTIDSIDSDPSMDNVLSEPARVYVEPSVECAQTPGTDNVISVQSYDEMQVQTATLYQDVNVQNSVVSHQCADDQMTTICADTGSVSLPIEGDTYLTGSAEVATNIREFESSTTDSILAKQLEDQMMYEHSYEVVRVNLGINNESVNATSRTVLDINPVCVSVAESESCKIVSSGSASASCETEKHYTSVLSADTSVTADSDTSEWNTSDSLLFSEHVTSHFDVSDSVAVKSIADSSAILSSTRASENEAVNSTHDAPDFSFIGREEECSTSQAIMSVSDCSEQFSPCSTTTASPAPSATAVKPPRRIVPIQLSSNVKKARRIVPVQLSAKPQKQKMHKRTPPGKDRESSAKGMKSKVDRQTVKLEASLSQADNSYPRIPDSSVTGLSTSTEAVDSDSVVTRSEAMSSVDRVPGLVTQQSTEGQTGLNQAVEEKSAQTEGGTCVSSGDIQQSDIMCEPLSTDTSRTPDVSNRSHKVITDCHSQSDSADTAARVKGHIRVTVVSGAGDAASAGNLNVSQTVQKAVNRLRSVFDKDSCARSRVMLSAQLDGTDNPDPENQSKSDQSSSDENSDQSQVEETTTMAVDGAEVTVASTECTEAPPSGGNIEVMVAEKSSDVDRKSVSDSSVYVVTESGVHSHSCQQRTGGQTPGHTQPTDAQMEVCVSANSSSQETGSMNKAMEIVAAVAPYLSTCTMFAGSESARSGNLMQSSTATTVHTSLLSSSLYKAANNQVTPTKNRYRPLAPKPGDVIQKSPPKFNLSPRKKQKSPRRKLLQQKAKSILPKGFIINTYISPVKKVAANLAAKARRVGRPKGARDSGPRTRSTSRGKIADQVDEGSNQNLPSCESAMIGDGDQPSEYDYDTIDSDYEENEPETGKHSESNSSSVKIDLSKKLVKKRLYGRTRRNSVQDSDTQSDVEDGAVLGATTADSQDDDEEDHMAQLMAASTTIRFAPNSATNKSDDKKTKAKKKRELTLSMLAPDMLETDPLRDERDTAFAQAYLAKVKQVLCDDRQKYEEFLKLLNDFGKNVRSPVQLHGEVCELLGDYPDLVDGFAGFLLPHQAQQCGCLMTNLEFNRARTFLRKLEVFFIKHPPHFQKILKAFSGWQGQQHRQVAQLKNTILPMLRGQQKLIDEFMLFFPDEKPPESMMTDFEEVTLDSDEENNSHYYDGFEEVELTDNVDMHYGTKKCCCSCHESSNARFQMRKRHCTSCGMQIIGGRLFLKTTKNLRPARVVYHHPVKTATYTSRTWDPPMEMMYRNPDVHDKATSTPVKNESLNYKDTTVSLSTEEARTVQHKAVTEITRRLGRERVDSFSSSDQVFSPDTVIEDCMSPDVTPFTQQKENTTGPVDFSQALEQIRGGSLSSPLSTSDPQTLDHDDDAVTGHSHNVIAGITNAQSSEETGMQKAGENLGTQADAQDLNLLQSTVRDLQHSEGQKDSVDTSSRTVSRPDDPSDVKDEPDEEPVEFELDGEAGVMFIDGQSTSWTGPSDPETSIHSEQSVDVVSTESVQCQQDDQKDVPGLEAEVVSTMLSVENDFINSPSADTDTSLTTCETLESSGDTLVSADQPVDSSIETLVSSTHSQTQTEILNASNSTDGQSQTQTETLNTSNSTDGQSQTQEILNTSNSTDDQLQTQEILNTSNSRDGQAPIENADIKASSSPQTNTHTDTECVDLVESDQTDVQVDTVESTVDVNQQSELCTQPEKTCTPVDDKNADLVTSAEAIDISTEPVIMSEDDAEGNKDTSDSPLPEPEQGGAEESADVITSINLTPPPSQRAWTRDEDKLILETCQQNGSEDSTFDLIAEQLSNRTKEQISERFHTLMALFAEHASDDEDSSSSEEE